MSKYKGCARVIPKNKDALFLPFQNLWITDKNNFKLMEKSRQIGLTWSTAYTVVERIAMADAKNDQWVSSRDELQAKLFIDDCKTFAKVMNLAAKDLGEVVLQENEKGKVTAYVIEFANGKKIYSMSSNPDAQAGKRGNRFLDEFAVHKDPKKLFDIAKPGLTWGGNLEIISTHRGSNNFFNQLIREVREAGNPKGISLHRVTLSDALEQGILWKLQQTWLEDDPRQEMDEEAYFESVRKGCSDEESFQQEYMCNPADDDSAFLDYELIASAEYNKDSNDWGKTEGGTLYAGLDIGRKNDLTVLWVVEKLGDVYYTRHVEAMKKMRKSDQEAIIYPWFSKCARVCLDYTGLGIGWGDDAQDTFGSHKVECITFTSSTKEALAWPVRGAMEDRKVRIPFDPKIRADLRAVTKQVSTGGAVRFTAERTADGHSDHFWALALALNAASQPVAPIEFWASGRRNSLDMRGYA